MPSQVERRVIRTVLYFDIFNHPLTVQEIAYFTTDSSNFNKVSDAIEKLISDGVLFEKEEFISVKPDLEKDILARHKGESVAKQELKKAYSRARFIGKFPYVRAAYISGSMSKGVMHEDGDVDYFIITEPGRLWIARTFLVLFKKTFLLNSHKFFCLNYFIDSDNLEIEEKNLFTATETVTLKPIYDSGLYSDFRNANKWVDEFLPHNKEQQVVYNGETKKPIGSIIEALLNNQIGDRLDEFFMHTTFRVWKRKFKHLETTDFDVALKTRKYVSKHHPQNFQSRVLSALKERVEAFEKQHNIKLD